MLKAVTDLQIRDKDRVAICKDMGAEQKEGTRRPILLYVHSLFRGPLNPLTNLCHYFFVFLALE